MSDIHALSGAYAVDALDDRERTDFEEHLAECAACRDEVAGLREAAAALAETAATAPPPSLRDRVLADAARTRPLPPVVAGLAGHAARQRGRRRALLAAAAAVAVVGGVGVATWQPWDRDEPPVVAEPSPVDRVLRADDAESLTLDFADGSRATVTRSVDEGLAVIQTHDMAAAPEGKVYELWLQHADGTMAPAGLMPSGPDNTVLLDGDAAEAVGAGITVEPDGGSEEPTSAPIAVFDFSEAT